MIGPIVIIALFVALVILLYYFKIDSVVDSQRQDYAVFYIMTVGGSVAYSAETASAYMFGSMIFLNGASWIYSILVFLSSTLTLICILLQNPRYRINISRYSVLVSLVAFNIENWIGYSANMLPVIISFLAALLIVPSALQSQVYIIQLNANNVINNLVSSGVRVIELEEFINRILGDNQQFTIRDLQTLYINKIDNYDSKKYCIGNLMVDKKGNKVYL